MSSITQSRIRPGTLDVLTRSTLAEVDKSLRFPLLFFVVCAILWLTVSNVLALVALFQSYSPNFLSGCEWFTYGRLYPVATNAMLFGWGCNAIFAIALWIIARLSQSPVRDRGLLIIAGLFWNFGLKVGLFGILAGDFISAKMLELPGYATPILIVAYALIGTWGVLTFLNRKECTIYVAQFYILGAFFWFPWLYMIAQFMVIWFPVRGVVQNIVSSWFASGFFNLWLTSVALATAYYLIPKVLGRPIYSYSLALLGFCSLALIGSWAGLAQMVDGPVPIWLPSVGIVASVLMIMPVGTVVLNLYLSVKGVLRSVWQSIVLRFIGFGVLAYLFVGIIGAAMAFRSVSEITQFTVFISGYEQLLVYAFFSMILFGGLYFMAPRLTKRDWPSADLIHLHFWGSASGIVLAVLALFIGGLISGSQMNDAEIPFIEVSQSLVIWLKVHTIGLVCLAVGHIAFAINFFWMLASVKAEYSAHGSDILESVEERGTA